MAVVVVGANHKSMPLDTLERLSISEVDRAKFAYGLVASQNVSEVVVLSTCNRTEVYGFAERFHGAYADIRAALAVHSGLHLDDMGDQLYVHWGEEAVSHLFSVAAGLDSAVIGETEIVGQLRAAWADAQSAKFCGTGLNLLFRQSLEVAKRARSETTISSHTTSVAGAAVQLAQRDTDSFADQRVVIIGAGQMGRTLGRLLNGSVAGMHFVNRTPENAAGVAAEFGASSSGFLDLDAHLVDADLVISATGSPTMILHREDVETALAARADRPMRLIDIAVPRDIDPGCRNIDGCDVLDMDSIRALIEAGIERRRDEIDSVETIVQEEVARYVVASTAREAGPLVRSMRERVEDVRSAELARYSSQIAKLSEGDQQLIDSITRSVIAKVLHNPSVRLKDTAGTLRGDRLADAARDLFDLDN